MRIFLVALHLFLLSFPSVTLAEEKSEAEKTPTKTNCASIEILDSRLSDKKKLLTNTQEQLEKFLGNSDSLSLAPSSLFLVNLSDPLAVDRRRDELAEYQKKPVTFVPAEYAETADCLKKSGASDANLKDVLSLERKIAVLRLQFLSLSIEHRTEILAKYASVDNEQHEATVKALSKAINVAEKEKNAAIEAKRTAEKRAQQTKDDELRELAESRARLEDMKSRLSAIEIEITKTLETRANIRKGVSDKLETLGNELVTSDSSSQLLVGYYQITGLWRQVSGRTLDLFANPDVLTALPELPPLPGGLLEKLKETPDAKAYQQSYEHAVKLRQDIVELQKNQWQKEVNRNYHLLKQVGQARSEYLLTLRSLGEDDPFSLSSAYLSDIRRELQLVPLRWRSLFYSKIVVLKTTLRSGISGVLRLLRELASFFVLLLAPFLLIFLSRKLRKTLDVYRQSMVRSHRRTKNTLKVALWIQRLNPYMQWIVAGLATWLTGYLLEGTVIEEFRTFLPYVYYYLVYRVFLQFLENAFSWVAFRSRAYNIHEFKERLHKTGTYVGTFFLLGVCSLHATETSVGRALVYQLVRTLILWCGYIVCAIAAYQWRVEIGDVLPDYLRGKIEKRAQQLLSGKLAILFALPLFLLTILIALGRFIWADLSEFDFVKRISAQIFRQKLESAAGDQVEKPRKEVLPEEYTRLFELSAVEEESIRVTPERDTLPTLVRILNEWKADSEDENSLALYGEKGIGKTTLIQRLGEQASDLRVISISVPGGLTEPEEVTRLFTKALGLPEGADISEIYKWDKDAEKTLVTIDNAHNLFLASVGGFRGYRKFLDIINLRLSNVFWCAAFNLHSWKYLNSVFKKSQFFRHAVAVQNWRDEDIESLILTRHRKSDFQLSYDDIIFATHSARNYETMNYAETQFFRLLWEQSKGNPRTALFFWLTSLRYNGGKTLRVGLPEEPQTKSLQDLKIDSLLVYASIVRHENLSVQEMVRTTEVSEGLVRQARKVGVERKFLERVPEGGRYRVSPAWQVTLTNFLVSKNLINAR